MEAEKLKRTKAKRKEKDPNKTVVTFQYRIKGSASNTKLNRLSSNVNLVWNYCNEAYYNNVKKYNKWLHEYDLCDLTSGTSKVIDISSVTVQSICNEFYTRIKQFKKIKLRWRVSKGSKRSLGWIPFKGNIVKVEGDTVTYGGYKYRLWLSRPIDGKVLSGSFSQDAQGHWYVNIVCEVNKLEHKHQVEDIGIDLGLKTSAVLSDGTIIENNKEFNKLQEKLAKAQRANKKKQAKKIHSKIRNKRKDFLHKETTKISKKYYNVFVGDVSGKFLQKTNGKSSTDASIGIIRSLLKYKAIKHSGNFYEVSENSSTVTCSTCFKKTGPSGLSDLGVREWICGDCHTQHNRDVNAAKNILRMGRHALSATKVA